MLLEWQRAQLMVDLRRAARRCHAPEGLVLLIGLEDALAQARPLANDDSG